MVKARQVWNEPKTGLVWCPGRLAYLCRINDVELSRLAAVGTVHAAIESCRPESHVTLCRVIFSHWSFSPLLANRSLISGCGMNNSAAGALQASFGVIRSSRISSRCVVWGPTDERIHTVVTRFFWR